ncbi:gcrA cell cycle regulator family protein [Vibrio vulnificus]|uniref:gcrA cell cycle regulator family protein n=1 Tax=Vibrio vulnificus TaxID=672 RepID=UPI0018DEC757|nr:gcrA cell cycle regulator family protein [Vibrio vulnificus]MBH9824340.1 gcrA cell cycle regulator family protein [Vibrio vulnificus]
MESSLLSSHVDLECSFSDLLIKRPVMTEEPLKPNTIRYWTDDEISQLKTLYRKGTPFKEMSLILNRTVTAINSKIKQLNLVRCKALSAEQELFLIKNYWLLGTEGCAKKLNRSRSAIVYYARLLNLKIPTRDQYNPPIYRQLLPYDMAKRLSILERKSPTSKDRIEDSVVILYDKYRPSKPMSAFHLDELCLAIDRRFGRRDGVTANALLHGYKAV